jgi:hypothetical protein
VVGFTVKGRVVDHKKEKGIEGATIKIDGQVRGHSQADGTFVLERVSSGAYTFKVEKENMQFPNLINYRVSPNEATLPDIAVESFHVCGKILIDQLPYGVSPTAKRSLTLTSTKEGAQPVTQTTDEKGT